jgi:hypothetical protein
MSWLDKLQDSALDVGDRLRYGMTAKDKYEKTWKGEFPGAPNRDPLDPETERYASGYAGAQNLAPLGKAAQLVVPTLFNTWAIDDLMNPRKAIANKKSGMRGALAGALGITGDGAEHGAIGQALMKALR